MGSRSKRLKSLVIGGMVAIGLIAGYRVVISRQYDDRIYHEIDDIPNEDEPRVAIVFGAGVFPNGRPTPVLYDRVATAADLYHAGVVQKLLMTGDNQETSYNEPEAMRQTAIDLGVPDCDIVLDYAGRRTYDSCYRAHYIFDVKNAVLVTQNFHLARALFLGDAFGIRCIGVAADRRDYQHATAWELREYLALPNAWLDVHVIKGRPILGSKEPISF